MASMASTSFGSDNRGVQVGYNYGSVHAEFHPPERPETPPSPLSTVPFPRDPDFVRRDTLLDQIHQKCLAPGSRIALVGLGGVGKSQLAIEYSYQIRSKCPATWIFWVHASNEARFEQSFRDIADQLKLPQRRDPRINIFQLVESWLQDERKGKWICILDNVDDDILCFSPTAKEDDPTNGPTNILNAPTKPLLEYVPRGLNGSTILTSRSRDTALRMANHKDIVEVKPMEVSEALDLLQKKLDQPGDGQESQQLVGALEFMPLAIVQAASYIRNRAPYCSVTQYLRDFQNDREAIKLLRKEVHHTYRDWEANHSIIMTWQISFEYIRQTRPSAADLLSLMSFFDRQGIPKNLLQDQPKANDISSAELRDDTSDEETSESDIGPDFWDDITMLRDYSFISISENGMSFIMHRLVQLSTRAWLKSHRKVEHFRKMFINNLSEEFPTGNYENWSQCQLLYPHVKCAMSERPEAPESQLKLSALLYKGAWYALGSGMIRDTSEMASKSRKYRLGLLGADNRAALASTSILGMAYRAQGRWEEAELLEVQVMEIRKTKLSEDHPDILMSMANLASTYWHQGRWEEAEQLGVQVMKTSKTKLGEDHPDTLTSMANLASTYRHQGRWEEAEQLEVQVLETSKTKLGEDHPDTLTCMANLASTYFRQGRWEEAEQLEVQVMKSCKTKLGEDHPDTLKSMANLAFTWKSSGRDRRAIDLLQHCYTKRRERLGLNHPETISTSRRLLMWETKKLDISS